MEALLVLKEKLIPAFFGGLAIFLIAYLIKLSLGNALLFASLGSSAVILSEFPDTPTAKLRVIILSYLMAAIIGYAFSFMSYVALAAGIATFLTIALMAVTNNAHAPAGGIALAFVFGSSSPTELVYVMLSVLILLIVLKSIIYLYKKELHIEKFHHEFLKK